MFFGDYRHNLDAKGRLTMPAEFRDELGAIVYVTKGFEGCLSVYSEEEFMKVLERMKELRDTNSQSRTFKRLMSANTRKLEVDKMGRINLPDGLIKQASLVKNCVVLGQFDHVEIWDQDIWQQFYDSNENSYEDFAEAAFEKDE